MYSAYPSVLSPMACPPRQKIVRIARRAQEAITPNAVARLSRRFAGVKLMNAKLKEAERYGVCPDDSTSSRADQVPAKPL
jgi:hypothetical protein